MSRCLPLAQWNLSRVLRAKPTVRPCPRKMLPAMNVTSKQLLSVAPMMDWTDVHYRQLARLLSRHTWLYTEMVVDQTLIHTSNLDRFLAFPPEQHPIVCQLGGSDPAKLAAAAKLVAQRNYDEINLNCGCPSDRVAGAGCFGAALMLQPQLVADCCKAVAEAVAECSSPSGGAPPITVKCRIGVDDCDSYHELSSFIKTVSEGSPVMHFIIHARKCHLKGLNPHQNRTIPPLRYEWVWALKRDFPHLEFSLNGGILSLEETAAALSLVNTAEGEAEVGAAAAAAVGNGSGGSGCGSNVVAANSSSVEAAAGSGITGALEDGSAANGSAAKGSGPGPEEAGAAVAAAPAWLHGKQAITGVMIGRAAYNMPWLTLADADRAIFGARSNPAASRRQVLAEYAKYADGVLERYHTSPPQDGWRGPSLRTLFKPLLGMFHNEPRAKKWRNAVDTALKTAKTVSEVLDATLPVLMPETLDAPPKPTKLAKPVRLQHFAPELPPPAGAAAAQPLAKRAKTS